MTNSFTKFLAILFKTLIMVIIAIPVNAKPISNQSQPLTIVTEDFPPLQIVENNQVVGGITSEIVQALLDITAQSAKTRVYTWGRAYKIAKENPNVMLYSITRSPTREPHFKWIGPIMALDNHLWRLKSRSDIKITHLEQAKNYRIAVPKGDQQHQRLERLGFSAPKHLQVVTRYNQTIAMLYRGRIDLIVGSKVILMHQLKVLGKDPKKVIPMINLEPEIGELYIAFGRKTSDRQVNKYRKALQTIKQNGTYQAIMKKWQTKVEFAKDNITP